MKNIKKHSILRVRKTSMTSRGRLGTMVIKDKKKDINKKSCRQSDAYFDQNYDYHDFDY